MYVHEKGKSTGGRPTVKEIARRAGVSIGTVDRVLHGRGEVAEPTRSRIEAIVANLDYRPDALARQLSLNRSWKLRVLLPRSDQDSGYWKFCRAGIESAAIKLADFRVATTIDEFDRYDGFAFRQLLLSIDPKHCDGLLIAPVLPGELRPALETWGSDLPYLFFDGSLEGTNPRACIGQDAFMAGRLAGRMLSLLAPGSTPLVAIGTHAEDRHIGRRIEGFLSHFASRANSAIAGREVFVENCLDLEQAEVAEAFLSDLWARRPRLSGILVANSAGHLVGSWLAGRELKGSCALLCWDLVGPNAEGLRSGDIDCVISQRPFEQGRLGLETLFASVSHDGEMSASRNLPIELWFKENLPAEDGLEELAEGKVIHGSTKR